MNSSSSLTYAPGLVGEITDWIVANAHRPCRVFALGAAVTVVGTLTSRYAVGPTGSPTHLYTVIVGPTARGKAWPCEAVAKLIKAAGARVHLGDFDSPAALRWVLTSTPPAAIVLDEIIGFLAMAASVRDRRLADVLCSLWSSTSAQVPSELSSEVSLEPVCVPSFSLFGTARDGEFWPLLQSANKAGRREFIDNVFSQFLVFESTDWQAEQLPPSPLGAAWGEVPAALKGKLVKLLHQFGSGPEGVFPRRLPWADDEAEEVFRQLNDWIRREIDNDPSQKEYLGHVPGQAERLATIRAAGIAGPGAKVDVADMTWGANLALALVTNTMKRARERPPVRIAYSQFAEKVVGYIVRHSPVTEQDLWRYIGSRYSTRVVMNILTRAIKAGLIIKTLNGYAVALVKK